MGLSNKKEEQLKEQPIIRTRMWKSKSGEHFVYQTTITEIKPVAYLETILSSEPLATMDEVEFAEA